MSEKDDIAIAEAAVEVTTRRDTKEAIIAQLEELIHEHEGAVDALRIAIKRIENVG